MTPARRESCFDTERNCIYPYGIFNRVADLYLDLYAQLPDNYIGRPAPIQDIEPIVDKFRYLAFK